ncbi:unnamed protein product [Discosporangium mesarthrocarpum]
MVWGKEEIMMSRVTVDEPRGEAISGTRPPARTPANKRAEPGHEILEKEEVALTDQTPCSLIWRLPQRRRLLHSGGWPPSLCSFVDKDTKQYTNPRARWEANASRVPRLDKLAHVLAIP